MKTTTLTKFTMPFRVNNESMDYGWRHMDGKTIFEIVEPEPKIERRWKWRKDFDGYTAETPNYMADIFVDGYYKVEDCYIDVEVK